MAKSFNFASLVMTAWLILCCPSYAEDSQLMGQCNGKDLDASIAACTAFLSTEMASTVIRSRALFSRGVRYQAKNDYEKAIADFTAAIDLDPTNGILHAARGVAYTRKENFELARRDLDQAIMLRPALADAYTARGLLNLYSGRMDEAISDSTKALSLDPKQQGAYNNRGAAYREKGEYVKAIEDFNVVIRLNPGASRPLYNRGLAYLRQGKTDQAIADFDATLTLNPSDPDAKASRDAVYAVRKPSSSVASPLPATSILAQTPDDPVLTIAQLPCAQISSQTVQRTEIARSNAPFGIPLFKWSHEVWSAFYKRTAECLERHETGPIGGTQPQDFLRIVKAAEQGRQPEIYIAAQEEQARLAKGAEAAEQAKREEVIRQEAGVRKQMALKAREEAVKKAEATGGSKRDIRGFVTGMSQAEIDLMIADLKCNDSKKDPMNGANNRRELSCAQSDGEIRFQFTNNNLRVQRISLYVVRPNPDFGQLLAFIEKTFSVRFPRDAKTNNVIANQVIIPRTNDWLSLRIQADGFVMEIADESMFADDLRQDGLKDYQKPMPKL